MLPVSLRLESVLNFGRCGDERGEVEEKWEGWITMTDPVRTFCKGVVWLLQTLTCQVGVPSFLAHVIAEEANRPLLAGLIQNGLPRSILILAQLTLLLRWQRLKWTWVAQVHPEVEGEILCTGQGRPSSWLKHRLF